MLRYMILHHVGFPIRKSMDRSLFAAPHGLSQLVTSFFGSWCQGIHLTLLFAWTSCIFPILWFSLNCLSFSLSSRSAELFVQDYIDSCRREKAISRLLHFILELRFRAFHLSVKLYHTLVCSLSFGKTKLSQRLFVLFCSFSTQKYFLLFDCQRSFGILRFLVGLDGLEPSTSRLSGARSSHLSYKPELTHRLYDSFICFCQPLLTGGDEGNRTLDPLLAGQVLSQLSYTPI